MTTLDLRVRDCVEGMGELLDSSVDVVVTSPPYNLGIKYKVYDDNRAKADYLAWTEMWTSEVFRVLKPDGSFFLNLGGSPTYPMLPHEVITRLGRSFVLQNTIHWIKSISIVKDGVTTSPGHFKPINSKRFLTDCHEYVFHLTKTGKVQIDRLSVGVPYVDKSNLRRWKHSRGKDVRCRGNTWFLPYKTICNHDKQRPHPATFPKDLPVMCLKLHGLREGMTVLDPFVGIGNSAVAAQELGIAKFIGFDIDPYYISIAKSKVVQPLLIPTNFNL
jgi:site-specific DNA-methyltransferase (adenine-specific)